MGLIKKQLYKFRIFAVLFAALITVPGWEFNFETGNDGLITAKNSDFTFKGNFGNSVFATDFGSNNGKIYFGISSYIYGVTHYGVNINADKTARAVMNNINRKIDEIPFNNVPISSSIDETLNSLYKNWNAASLNLGEKRKNSEKNIDKLNLEPVTTVKYIVKITNFVKFSARNKNGKKTYNISRGRLTQGLCSIKVDNTNISRSIYYYKLETDEGTITKKWFC